MAFSLLLLAKTRFVLAASSPAVICKFAPGVLERVSTVGTVSGHHGSNAENAEEHRWDRP